MLIYYKELLTSVSIKFKRIFGVFLVHCCSIFNERFFFTRRLVDSLYIISQSIALVKRFLKLFQVFFEAL